MTPRGELPTRYRKRYAITVSNADNTKFHRAYRFARPFARRFTSCSQEVSTIQVGKEGDVWDGLRASLKEDRGGHHDVRNRSAGILLWNLLNEALRECDHIDESFEVSTSVDCKHIRIGLCNTNSCQHSLLHLNSQHSLTLSLIHPTPGHHRSNAESFRDRREDCQQGRP